MRCGFGEARDKVEGLTRRCLQVQPRAHVCAALVEVAMTEPGMAWTTRVEEETSLIDGLEVADGEKEGVGERLQLWFASAGNRGGVEVIVKSPRSFVREMVF